MSIRSELQQRLKTFCDAQNPPLTIALENVPFTKPTTTFLECFVSPSGTINPTVDAKRTRERGVFTINCWSPSGPGMGSVETLARAIVAAFPVVPVVGTVNIEQTPSTSKAITDIAGWIVLPITIQYRYESTV